MVMGRDRTTTCGEDIIRNWAHYVHHVIIKSADWPAKFDTFEMFMADFGAVTSSQGLATSNLLDNQELFACMERDGFTFGINSGVLNLNPVNILKLPLSPEEVLMIDRLAIQGSNWEWSRNAPTEVTACEAVVDEGMVKHTPV